MPLGIGDELSVRVTADTGSFNVSMNRAKENLEDVSSQAQQTAGSLSATGAAATGAASSFGALALSTNGVSVGFGTLSTSLTTSLPLLAAVTAAVGALTTAMLPLAAVVGTVTAGLGALAAAFGTVIGTGIIAFGAKRGEQNQKRLQEVKARIEALEELKEQTGSLTEQQQNQLETLKERKDTLEEQTGIFGGLSSALKELGKELKPIVVEFGSQFVPLIEDAINAIPRLVRNIFSAIGGMGRFVDVLRQLGNQAFRVIPEIVAGIFELARVALPPLMQGIKFISQNAAGAFRGMLRITRELAPEFIKLGKAFVNALPQLAKLGTLILNTAIPALTKLTKVIDGVLEGLESGSLFKQLKDFISTAINDVIAWFNNEGKKKIANIAIDLLGTLADTIQNLNTSKIRTKIVKPLLKTLGNAFDTLVKILGSDQFQELLRQLSEAMVDTAQVLLSSLADAMIAYARSGAFKEDLKNLGIAVINATAAVIQGAVTGIVEDLPQQPARGGQALRGRKRARQSAQQRGQNQANQVEVIVQGDNKALEEFINVEVNNRLDEQQGRIIEGSGTNPGPR